MTLKEIIFPKREWFWPSLLIFNIVGAMAVVTGERWQTAPWTFYGWTMVVVGVVLSIEAARYMWRGREWK